MLKRFAKTGCETGLVRSLASAEAMLAVALGWWKVLYNRGRGQTTPQYVT